MVERRSARRTGATGTRCALSERQPPSSPGSYRADVEDVQLRDAVTRIAVFLCALVLVVGAGWTAGRVSNPPIPIPDLPRPGILGGPGQDGSDAGRTGGGITQDETAIVVPRHGHRP